MVKKLLFTVICLSGIMLFASCNDDDPAGPAVTQSSNYNMITASGEVIRSIGKELPTINLIMSNTAGLNTPGQYISLSLRTEVSYSLVRQLIPTGEYVVSADNSKGKTIALSADSHFTIIDNNNKVDTRHITGGSIHVYLLDGKYTITGDLTGSGSSRVSLNYNGNVDVEIAGIETNEKLTLTSSVVIYNNKMQENSLSVYPISLTNQSGETLNIELFAPYQTTFRDIAEGTYTLATVEEKQEAYKINCSDKTYYTNANNQTHFISDANLEFKKVSGGYSITGDIMRGDGEIISVDFNGKLDVTKTILSLSGMDFYVMGQINAYSTYSYYYMMDSGKKGSFGEEVKLFATTPINRFYEYLPVEEGRSIVSTKMSDLVKPYTIIVDDMVSENGVFFRNSSGARTQYEITAGTMDLECKEVKKGYRFNISGMLTVTNKNNMSLEVEYSYEGVVADADNYAFGAHPYSTITTNRTFNKFDQGIYWRADNNYWDSYGATGDQGWLVLTLATEDAEWDSWDDEYGDPSDTFMMIGLNIPSDTPPNVIPVGTYTIDSDWTFAPGTFMPGTKWGQWSNIFQSTMIFNGDISTDIPFGYGAGDSSITIAWDENDDTYTITVKGYDDKGPNANKITASYTGYIDNERDLYSRSKPYLYRGPSRRVGGK